MFKYIILTLLITLLLYTGYVAISNSEDKARENAIEQCVNYFYNINHAERINECEHLVDNGTFPPFWYLEDVI